MARRPRIGKAIPSGDPVGRQEGRWALSVFVAILLFSFAIEIVSGQDSSWTRMAPPTAPSPRVGHAMAYDAESDRVVLFGGETAPLSNVLNNETWAYDLDSNTWDNRNPLPRPSARFAHAMAYDADSDRVILFGGWTGTGQSTETWAYDQNTDTWTNVAPATSPPAGVFLHMAYDAESDRVILFGGSTERFAASSNETWAYNFDSNTWTRMNPGNSPSVRQTFGMMAYDAESDRTTLFGGYDGTTSFADTWTYHYNTDAWTRMSPETAPSARHAGAMAYDAGTDRVVLFGGNAGVQSDETWIYDANRDTWALAGTGTAPSRRFGAAVAYDVESVHVVLFGGSSGGDETWSIRFGVSMPNLLWLYVTAGAAIGAVAVLAVLLLWKRKRKRRGES